MYRFYSPVIICFIVLLVIPAPGSSADKPNVGVSCYSYPIAKEFLLSPDLIYSKGLYPNENLWLGKISNYSIRKKAYLSFEIIIIAKQYAFNNDSIGNDIDKIKSNRINVSQGDMGTFAVYLEINPRNLSQRNNLIVAIEDELDNENSYVFAKGRVDRFVTYKQIRYPLLSYSQISFGPDYKIKVIEHNKLFRTDIPFGKEYMNSDSDLLMDQCTTLSKCNNRLDKYAAKRCKDWNR